MTSAAESITESLRRSRQMMVQVSMFLCLINLVANKLLILILKLIVINVDRKWKELQIRWQLSVCIPLLLIKHVRLQSV
jgi:hypothetical protein